MIRLELDKSNGPILSLNILSNMLLCGSASFYRNKVLAAKWRIPYSIKYQCPTWQLSLYFKARKTSREQWIVELILYGVKWKYPRHCEIFNFAGFPKWVMFIAIDTYPERRSLPAKYNSSLYSGDGHFALVWLLRKTCFDIPLQLLPAYRQADQWSV